jgi:hypothetical protein
VVRGRSKRRIHPNKGGQGGKGPIEKQSREEKAKGGKEQEKGRSGPVAIGARADDRERRFWQKVLVIRLIRRQKSVARVRKFLLALGHMLRSTVDRGSVFLIEFPAGEVVRAGWWPIGGRRVAVGQLADVLRPAPARSSGANA